MNGNSGCVFETPGDTSGSCLCLWSMYSSMILIQLPSLLLVSIDIITSLSS